MGWLEGSGGGSSGGCWLLAWWLEARSRASTVKLTTTTGEAASAHTRKELGDAASLGRQSQSQSQSQRQSQSQSLSPPGTPHNRGHGACENVL